MHEENLWWKCAEMYGVDYEIRFTDGTVVESCTTHPEDHGGLIEELTEFEFAELLRAKFVAEYNAWPAKRAVQEAAIAASAVERDALVAQIVGSGIPPEAAEMMVPAAPTLPSGEFSLPEGTEAWLKEAYRLSPEAIAVVLAPFEGS